MLLLNGFESDEQKPEREGREGSSKLKIRSRCQRMEVHFETVDDRIDRHLNSMPPSNRLKIGESDGVI